MSEIDAKTKWLALLRGAVEEGTLSRLTLGAPCGEDATLEKLFVRLVTLRAGRRLCFVFRHRTRDITKNLTLDEGLVCVEELLGTAFRSAVLFTNLRTFQLELRAGRPARLIEGKPVPIGTPDENHDRPKMRRINSKNTAWLYSLGVTTADGAVTRGMEAKFRQINKFVELLDHSLKDAGPGRLAESSARTTGSLTLVDMGCGKGYLTFAAYDWLRRSGWPGATVRGIETRAELVELCSRAARESQFDGLLFEAGTISGVRLDEVDVLVALHACDTATDDAIARGVTAGASLILVAPCCHQELRPLLRPPLVLEGALRHGILLEREAEFVTDALRAALLEWAGYDTRVFEFISTEHTSKNLMIAATKRATPGNRDELGRRAKELAAFYGIRTHRLAGKLGFDFS